MKKYEELSIMQMEMAIDESLRILLRSISEGTLVITFREKIKNDLMNDILMGTDDPMKRYESITKSKFLIKDLIDLATSSAETAWYPEKEDFIIKEIAV